MQNFRLHAFYATKLTDDDISYIKDDRTTSILYNFIKLIELTTPDSKEDQYHGWTKEDMNKKIRLCEDYQKMKKEILGYLKIKGHTELNKIDIQGKLEEILHGTTAIKKERENFSKQLAELKLQIKSQETDLELKDSIIEEQLVYSQTQNDYIKYKKMYSELNKKHTNLAGRCKLLEKSNAENAQKSNAETRKKEKKIKDLQDQANRAKEDVERFKKEIEKKAHELKKLRAEKENLKATMSKREKSEKELRVCQKREILDRDGTISAMTMEIKKLNCLINNTKQIKSDISTGLECSICTEDYQDAHHPVR